MGGPAFRAAIVVPHLDDRARLAGLMRALAPQARADVALIVVDNGSAGGPEGLAPALAPARAAWPGLRLVLEPAPGAAAARNRGVAETGAPLLLFLDADCRPAPDWLERALAAAEEEAGAGILAGRVTLFDETPPPRTGAQAFETVFAFDVARYVRAGYGVTANLVVRRAVLEAVGGFRTGVAEDVDLCRRAVAAGVRLAYAPGIVVAHPTRPDWPALRAKWLRLTREGWALRPRGAVGRLRWAGRGLALVPAIAAHAPRVLAHPALDAAGKARALAVLARLRLLRCRWMLAQARGHDIT